MLGTDLGQAVVANAATQILLRQAPQAIDAVADTFACPPGSARSCCPPTGAKRCCCAGAHRVAFQRRWPPRRARPDHHRPGRARPARPGGGGPRPTGRRARSTARCCADLADAAMQRYLDATPCAEPPRRRPTGGLPRRLGRGWSGTAARRAAGRWRRRSRVPSVLSAVAAVCAALLVRRRRHRRLLAGAAAGHRARPTHGRPRRRRRRCGQLAGLLRPGVAADAVPASPTWASSTCLRGRVRRSGCGCPARSRPAWSNARSRPPGPARTTRTSPRRATACRRLGAGRRPVTAGGELRLARPEALPIRDADPPPTRSARCSPPPAGCAAGTRPRACRSWPARSRPPRRSRQRPRRRRPGVRGGSAPPARSPARSLDLLTPGPIRARRPGAAPPPPPEPDAAGRRIRGRGWIAPRRTGPSSPSTAARQYETPIRYAATTHAPDPPASSRRPAAECWPRGSGRARRGGAGARPRARAGRGVRLLHRAQPLPPPPPAPPRPGLAGRAARRAVICCRCPSSPRSRTCPPTARPRAAPRRGPRGRPTARHPHPRARTSNPLGDITTHDATEPLDSAARSRGRSACGSPTPATTCTSSARPARASPPCWSNMILADIRRRPRHRRDRPQRRPRHRRPRPPPPLTRADRLVLIDPDQPGPPACLNPLAATRTGHGATPAATWRWTTWCRSSGGSSRVLGPPHRRRDARRLPDPARPTRHRDPRRPARAAHRPRLPGRGTSRRSPTPCCAGSGPGTTSSPTPPAPRSSPR